MDYKVTDTELTSIANAIRTKGGTQTQLEFPSEFISAIGNISGGGTKNILSGTDAPNASLGSDGDIYLQTVAKGFKCNSNYLVNTTTQRLCTHSKVFYKTNDNPAICAHIHAGNYYGPLLVSDDATAVQYTGNTGNPLASFVLYGKTWYVGTTNSWNTSPDDPTIPTLYDTEIGDINASTAQSWAEALFSAANVEVGDTYIVSNTYCKVNGTWQNLIGTDIDDVNTGN